MVESVSFDSFFGFQRIPNLNGERTALLGMLETIEEAVTFQGSLLGMR